ncbi:MAG: sigma-70 family RNA polymerase sigma factor [Lachnospiraceae bacterium]|nr:sigma-70 family RNA polymerase sigma factor [Lachnospiraceae bacterium]
MTDTEIQNYMNLLFSAAVQKCDCFADAEDLVQETILAALTFLQKGGMIEQPRAWLLTVLNRKYYALLRKKYQLSVTHIGEDFDIAAEDDFVSDMLRAKEAERIRQEVSYLSESYRAIIARYYFHGESIRDIAASLQLAEGTVKSRLDFGRKQLKKGMDTMENYTENSYLPQTMFLRNSGVCGLNDEPMSLVPDDDVLSQNLLILAYEKPVSISELSRAIGVSAAYVEPIINRLVDGELMQRMGDGKVYTDFIIYHAEDYVTYIKEQEQFVTEHADAYLPAMQQAIDRLKQTDFYSPRLERYMLINIAENALWKSLESHRKPQIFPDRPNGGKWIAFATIYPENYVIPEGKRGKEEYALSGQRRTQIEQYLDATGLELYNYESSLYPYPKHEDFGFHSYQETERNMLKLFYLIHKEITPESVDLDPLIVKTIPMLAERGFLAIENHAPNLLIPCLTHTQAETFWNICREAAVAAAKELEAPMAAYVQTHKKKIPMHLKSVPEQKLTMPYEPQAMMLVYEAISRGLHPRELGSPCPETIVVMD